MNSRTAHARIRCWLVAALVCLSLAQPTLARGKVTALLHKSDAWFASSEGRSAADNVLSHQLELGGWNAWIDITTQPFEGEHTDNRSAFDNGSTTDELRVMARAFTATGDVRYKAAFERGLDYILLAQYANGGWPHMYPAGLYYRRITFSDDCMVGLVEFVHDVFTNAAPPAATQEEPAASATDSPSQKPPYSFLSAGRRRAAGIAFDRGVQCILKCQIKANGKLTGWCAQYDQEDLSPSPPSAKEQASINAAESPSVIRLLMSIEKPSPEVVQAIEGAVAWLEEVKIKGIRIEWRGKWGKDRDMLLVPDPAAPPLWARYYQIGTNKPIYTDRDGVMKPSIAELSHERRIGGSWLGPWPQTLLEKDYPAWKMKRK